MKLRYLVENVIHDYFSYRKEPRLQLSEDLGVTWKDIPIEIHCVDMTNDKQSTDTVSIFNGPKNTLPSMPNYPHTTSNMD